MVVKMHDILTSARDGDHRLPPISDGTCEDIRASDKVGVGSVVAPTAQKPLAIPVCFIHRSTQRAAAGGVSGVYADSTNTVLLRELFDPCFHLPRCPRGHRLPKRLASVLAFSGLYPGQVLNRYGLDLIPRQLLYRPVYVVGALRACALLCLAAGFLSGNFLAKFLHVRADRRSVGACEQLVDTHINTQFRSRGLQGRVGDINVDGNPPVAQGAPLLNGRTRHAQPVIGPLVRLDRDDNAISFNQTCDSHRKVKGAREFVYSADKAAEIKGAPHHGTGGLLSQGLRRLARQDDGFQGLLQTVGLVPVGKTSTADPVHRGLVEFSAGQPQGVDELVRDAVKFPAQGIQPPLLGGCKVLCAELDSADHLDLRLSFGCSGFDRDLLQQPAFGHVSAPCLRDDIRYLTCIGEPLGMSVADSQSGCGIGQFDTSFHNSPLFVLL